MINKIREQDLRKLRIRVFDDNQPIFETAGKPKEVKRNILGFIKEKYS